MLVTIIVGVRFKQKSPARPDVSGSGNEIGIR